MRLVALAWDAKQRRPRIFVCGDGLEDLGVGRDNVPVEMHAFFGTATVAIAKHWQGGSPTDPASFDPVEGAKAVYETARAVPFPMFGHGGPARLFIGGQLQAVELSATGLEAFQLHDWGDRIGATITLSKELEAAS